MLRGAQAEKRESCRMKSQVVLLTLVATTLSSAIPRPDADHKNRVMDKQDLSDQEHFKDTENHNREYDHEAFLGKDDAKTFDDLTPEEAKDRLGIIYNKIDRDGDHKVTEEELKDWIKHVQNRYVWSDTERQWKEHDIKDDRLAWEDYQKRTYGFLQEEEESDEQDDSYSYKEMMKRDKRRWEKADKDQDGFLVKDEFADFLHPEDAEHMRDIVIEETIEDIDKNGDGFISVEEYIDDLDNYEDDDDDEEDTNWRSVEISDFHKNKDRNGDGLLDAEEVGAWILPDGFDYISDEANHLLDEADEDEDGFLTREEVVNKYDLFVGSQATDFGEALAKHDEF